MDCQNLSSSDSMDIEHVVPQAEAHQPVDKNLLDTKRELGEGTYGCCSLVHRLNPESQQLEELAMKQAKIDGDVREQAEAFLANEINVLNRLDHRGVVALVAQVTDSNDTHFRAFLMEFLTIGSVFKYYTGQSGQQFIDYTRLLEHRIKFCQEIAEAIDYVHSTNIVHGDISCNNVVLTVVGGRPSPKLCDFGAAIDTSAVLIIYQAVGTYLYCSPEVYCRQGCTRESDVFSFGMLCYFIKYMRQPLLEGNTMDDVKRACNLMHGIVRNGRGREFSCHRPEIDETNAFDQLIKRCWHEEPRRRITMREFLHEFANLST